MNKYQVAYTVAKAQHEARKDEYIAFMQPYEYLLDGSDEEQERYFEISDTAPNEVETVTILLAAEDALIDWSLNKVSKIAHIGEEMAAIEIVRKSRLNLTQRQQIIEAALKLS